MRFEFSLFEHDDFHFQFFMYYTTDKMKLPPWIVATNILLSETLKKYAAEGNMQGVLYELKSGRCHINAADKVSIPTNT